MIMPNHSVSAMTGALFVVLVSCWPVLGDDSPILRALAMHGEATFPDGPQAPFDWINPDAPQGGTLRLAETGTFDSMNPYIVFGLPARGLGLVFQSLLYRSPDEPFTLYPQLAQGIQLAPDRSWIIFHLDPGARFQDSTPVTSADVLFTFNVLLNDGKPHTQTYYAGVTQAQAIDDLTIRFDLVPDNWELPMILGLMPVMSEAYFRDIAFERTSLETPLGTGPYKVALIEPGRRVIYQRDPDYWGNDLASSVGRYNFETIEYTWIRDSNVALQAFLAGDSDLRFEADPLRWATGYDSPAVEEGRIVMEEVAATRPSGLFAVVWNQRRPPFDDILVREALGLAFDFAWTNANLLHGQYVRTNGLFDNSALAPSGPAAGLELGLLEPWREQLPEALFDAPFVWPETDGSGRLREHLNTAGAMLDEAGYVMTDGVRRNADGQELSFEVVLADSTQERILLPWIRNLERLGVTGTLRTIDAAQHQARISEFDYDAMVWRWGVSLSPGNEQWIYWGSDAASALGSRNYAGLADPVLDSLIASLSDARSAEDLIAAARALDRVLMWGRHVLPLYHRVDDPIAYWGTIERPQHVPLYGVDFTSWWSAGR
jgi:microcin C transport system substrate-binding protein